MPHKPPSLRTPESLIRSLLECQDMDGLAQTAVRHLRMMGCKSVQLAWNIEPVHANAEQSYPSGGIDPSLSSLLMRVHREGGEVQQQCVDSTCTEAAFLLSRKGPLWAILLYRLAPETAADPEHQIAWQDALNLLSLRCQPMLEAELLRLDVERLSRAERLQRALFAISDCASSDRTTAEVLREMHQIVGRLMYARNFFIVRYTAKPETMRVIYFADSQDSKVLDLNEVIDAAQLGNSATLAMMRLGRPIHGPSSVIREQLSIVEGLGADSEDWLGVPMLEDGVVRGGVVVQSYDRAVSYSEDDQTLLVYVAQNIQTALARRDAVEETERQVAERTLALRQEVTERRRSERLQVALFRIAEVASSGETIESFYATIHSIVGELLDARNFYIALLSESGEEISFPFTADEHHSRFETRKLARGLSEYVLRTGRPLLTDPSIIAGLAAAGEAESMGMVAACWLGVPLMIAGKAIGLIAVQSYTPDHMYTARDEELLSFVSFHIANALERRKASESLHIANLQLEHASQTDPLTGLHNRRYLTGQIPVDLAFYDREHGRSRNSEQALVFAIVDIDHFKRINDTFGHRAGDWALQMFAQVLRGLVQTGDYIVRWGGEEFLLVFRPMSRQSVPALGERIRRRVAEHMFDCGEGVRLPLTCSIGLAEYPLFRDAPHELGWEQTVELADAALYWVKNHGRDGWAAMRAGEQCEPKRIRHSLQLGAQALLDSQQLTIISSNDERTEQS